MLNGPGSKKKILMLFELKKKGILSAFNWIRFFFLKRARCFLSMFNKLHLLTKNTIRFLFSFYIY